MTPTVPPSPAQGETAGVSELPIKLREAADRILNHCFNKSGDSALVSIPADRSRDVDLLLFEAADQLEVARQQLAELHQSIADERIVFWEKDADQRKAIENREARLRAAEQQLAEMRGAVQEAVRVLGTGGDKKSDRAAAAYRILAALAPTCGGLGEVGGHLGQTPESFEYVTEPCPDCAPAAEPKRDTKESPLAKAVRLARGDHGPPTEPMRWGDVFNRHLAKGEDHASAAYAADKAEGRAKRAAAESADCAQPSRGKCACGEPSAPNIIHYHDGRLCHVLTEGELSSIEVQADCAQPERQGADKILDEVRSAYAVGYRAGQSVAVQYEQESLYAHSEARAIAYVDAREDRLRAIAALGEKGAK